MLRAAEKISDLIFSPGRPPQVQVYGQMIPVQVPGFTMLTPDDTRHIAADLIGDNKTGDHDPARAWGLRHFLRTAGAGALSGQHFYSARQLRGGHARDSDCDSGLCFAATAASSWLMSASCAMESCW